MGYKYNYLCGASFENIKELLNYIQYIFNLISTVSLANQEDILPFKTL